ncbi:MAG: type I DNA topoisomerase [Planctomycetota bacterium]|nr:type I DNA topoisomerase [Planctomycetota bacterium]
MAKKPTRTTKTTRKPASRGSRKGVGAALAEGPVRDASGKKLVIVESPAKAKTINKYLGSGYIVEASVGHVRDLPSKSPKGVKTPVPGVDLDHRFAPTYEVLPGKTTVISKLKKLARQASEIWFATDLDREGEAIAWHIAEELGVDPTEARRVMFAAITKDEIQRAFANPHPINIERVNAQQARRILDRIVGYMVSPLLWKKVAGGLSAGRVQSVALRLVVEREREIRQFVPDERWEIEARFTTDLAAAGPLSREWNAFLAQRDEKNNPPTLKSQNAWMAARKAVRAELVDVGGKPFSITQPGDARTFADLAQQASAIATLAGIRSVRSEVREDEKARGPARYVRTVTGEVDPAVRYRVVSMETKRSRTRPPAPFITSTLQQAASSRLGFGAQRTMRAAQRLYEGVEVPGEGAVGLITYMRTDSTHLSGDALNMARGYVERTFGDRYLPEKPNFFSSSNKAAQEAHEAIRPTNVDLTPARLKSVLEGDLLKLYTIIWERFVACQMVSAEWDSTAVLIRGGTDPARELTFRATGRVLAFDGFYKVAGVPTASDEQTLPALNESQALAPFAIQPEQKFSSPPPRFSEASLIKTLEAEGIGRPSTYASIISVIQDREYVEQIDRRFYATYVGEVVNDFLIKAIPEIMEVGYTREMETELDHIEDEHKDWTEVLDAFYKKFVKQLQTAGTLPHEKGKTTPAPQEYACATCGAPTVYRLGKGGRFLSCSRYPDCSYAAPVDRDGKPRTVETVNVACFKCGRPMTKRSGRFGAFLGCSGYSDKANPCDGIIKLDKKGLPVAPATPPLETDLPCPKCQSPLYVRGGVRGPWLSCSAFPRCRARGKWSDVPEDVQKKWLAAFEAHQAEHPTVILKDLQGHPLTDSKGKPLARPEDGRAGPDDAAPGESDSADIADLTEVA